MTQGTLAEQKWVRVMTDYGSDGLWNKSGAAVDAESLPVSDALKAQLAAWCERYEKSGFYLAPEDRQNASFDVVAHGNEGRVIARAIKAHLPDWTVIYYDEAVYEIVGSDAPRGCYEYEIVDSEQTTKEE